MTTFARSILLRPRTGRTATKLLVGLIAAAVALASPTRPSPRQPSAIVESVESTNVGLQPRRGQLFPGRQPALHRGRRIGFFDPLPRNVRKPGRATRCCTAANVYLDLLGPHKPLPQRLESADRHVPRERQHRRKRRSTTCSPSTSSTPTSPTNRPTTASTSAAPTPTPLPYPASGCTDPHPLKEANPVSSQSRSPALPTPRSKRI